MVFTTIFTKKKISLQKILLNRKRMHEIVDRNEEIIREVWTREEAVDFLKMKKNLN